MSESSQIQPKNNDKDVSIKEIIQLIKLYSVVILRGWKLALACIMIVAAIFTINALLDTPVYESSLTFMVNEENGSGSGGVSAVLGGFGFPSQGNQNFKKIEELAHTRRIIHEVILDKFEFQDTLDFVGNHLIKLYDFQKNWVGSIMEGFSFQGDDFSKLTRLEERALLGLYRLIAKGNQKAGIKALLKTTYDKDTGILTVEATTKKESLSLFLAESLYNNLSAFYIEETIEKPRLSYELFKEASDSIYLVLSQKEIELARVTDASFGVVLSQNQLNRQKLMRDVQILTVMYTESIRNRETAHFILKNSTPFFQVIDPAMGPLSRQKANWLDSLFLGAFVGFFLSALFLIMRKVITDAVDEPENDI